jgi:hypothetical protein
MLRVRRWTGVSPLGVSGIVFSNFWARQYSIAAQKNTKTYQLVEHTLVQPPLLGPAVPELLVVVLKALPVGAELVEAVVVDVLDPAGVSVREITLRGQAYTLAAQRVTLRPSFMHSSSPRPLASVLHIM